MMDSVDIRDRDTRKGAVSPVQNETICGWPHPTVPSTPPPGPLKLLAGPKMRTAVRDDGELDTAATPSGVPDRRLEFQLCAWFVGPRGFVLVLSTARAMEHGLSPFGRASLHPRRNPLDRQRWKCPPGGPHDPSRDRSRQDIPLAWRAAWFPRVGITAPGQARNTIEKEPQTASLRRIYWDQSTV
jgi:hypothetical protein